MSRINYLILVHKNPEQFSQLFGALDAPWCNFFIHVDKKVNAEQFKEIVPEKENVCYVDEEKRIDGRWGDLSLVDAALACMRLALKKSVDGHFVLLSGQDFPLRSPEYIRNFFDQHKDNDFMSVYPIPDPKKASENGGMERLISYTFDCRNPRDPRMKAKIQPLSLRLKTFLGFFRLLKYRRDLLSKAIKLYFVKRKYPNRLSKHFNEFWCALRKSSVEKILEVFDQCPEIREYYKYTHIPDETAFSSILLADSSYERMLLPMCHYIDWTSGVAGSPKFLAEGDIPKIRERMVDEPYLMFARKFDYDEALFEKMKKALWGTS